MKNRVIHRCFVPKEEGVTVSRAEVPKDGIPIDVFYYDNVVYVIFQVPEDSFKIGLEEAKIYNVLIVHNSVPFDLSVNSRYLGSVIRGVGDHINGLGNMVYTWSIYYEEVV